MDQSVASALVDRTREVGQAHIVDSRIHRGQTVQRIRIDLSTERRREDPRPIDFPFQSFFIESASSPSAFLYFLPGTKELSQDHFRAGYRDGWGQDYPIDKAFIFWPAQNGAWVDVVFFFDSNFRSGSQVNVNAGGVSINEGSSVKPIAAVTLLAGVAAQLVPQNLFRTIATLENKSGATIYLGGDSTVNGTGATEGIMFGPGERLAWKNTAALWGFSVGGGKVTILEQENT